MVLVELGVQESWSNFLNEISRPVKTIEGKPHLSKQLAKIHIETLLEHLNIMLDLSHRLAESYGRELDCYNAKLKLRLEVDEMLLAEEAALGKLVPTKNLAGKPVEGLGGASNTTFESREMARENLGQIRQMYIQLSSSEDYSARLTRHGEALKVFGAGVSDAIEAINKRADDICKTYGIMSEGEALGAQLGPDYFRGKEPIYSGPQNVSRKPSGDTDYIMSQSKCVCVYCGIEVEKKPSDLNTPCEHLICPRCTRMLGTKTGIPNDKRIYDYGDLKHHPHAGTKP